MSTTRRAVWCLLSQSWRVMASIYNCWRNTDPPLHSGDNTTVEIFLSRGTATEEGEDGEFGKDTFFLQSELLTSTIYKKENNKWGQLCAVIDPRLPTGEEETPTLDQAESVHPSRQRRGAVSMCENEQTEVRSVAASIASARFGPLRIFSCFLAWKIGPPEKNSRRTMRSLPSFDGLICLRDVEWSVMSWKKIIVRIKSEWNLNNFLYCLVSTLWPTLVTRVQSRWLWWKKNTVSTQNK